MQQHPHFLWTDLFRKKEDKTTIIQALQENVLFCTLSPSELRYLATIVYQRTYAPDEAVFHQNDRGFGMYLIVKGRIGIKTQSEAGELLVTTLGPGSFFGELSLVEPDNIRTASAISAEQSALIGFFKPNLMEILERKPAMGVKILFQLAQVLGRRLLETTEKITELKKQRL